MSSIVVGGKVDGWGTDTLLCDVATAMLSPLSGTTMLVFDVISLRGRGGSEVCVDDLIEELMSGMPESLLKIILISEP